MNIHNLPTDKLGVVWVQAWGKRGVITGCFGLPPREIMIKDLEKFGMGAVTDPNAPPPLPSRPWWQSWGVIAVVGLTVGLLLWQPTMKKNRRRRLMRRNPKLVNNRRRRRTSRRIKRNPYLKGPGRFGSTSMWHRTVVVKTKPKICKDCGQEIPVGKLASHVKEGSGKKPYFVHSYGRCPARPDEDKAYRKNSGGRTSRLRRNTCKHTYVSTGTWVYRAPTRKGESGKDYLISKCTKCGRKKKQTQAQQMALAKGSQFRKRRTSRLFKNTSERRKRENVCGRSATGHDYQYAGQYGKDGRIVLSWKCTKCQKTKKRYNDSKSWLRENAKGSNREVRDIIRVAEQAGWKVEWTKKGHIQFKSPYPNTPIVVAAGTPSDHRALKNLRSMLKRAGLQLEENAKTHTKPCEACRASGDAPGTWPIEACVVCDGTGRRPETDEERRKREKRNARGRARSDAMRSVGMRKSRYGGWE